MVSREKIRNIAIIAHVDHGKTTLVDAMLRQSGTFRENQQVVDRVMDSDDIERERGITILAKNTSIYYKDIKINIVDTPGHADFGGEVERSLGLVDGVLLLVDAFEGCMPQTRFVLKKALGLGLRVIIVINKIDRPNARPHEVVDEVLELLLDLDADESYLDSPVVFASGRDGWASLDTVNNDGTLKVLFDIIENQISPPKGTDDGAFQMLVSNIEYDNYTGRIAVGRINRGEVSLNDQIAVCRQNGEIVRAKVSGLYTFEGLKRSPAQRALTGEIAAVSAISDINIGDSICALHAPEPLEPIKIDEPVLTMNFSVNDSPFAGQDGAYVTSRHLRDRLYRELDSNISLKVEDTDSADTFKISGRGELHIAVLIENMRRQGYEFSVSKPKIITRIIDGIECEPIECLAVDVPEEYAGTVIETVSLRKGELVSISPLHSYSRLDFMIPSRGLIGFRSEMLTKTKGTAVINSIFEGYEPMRGDFLERTRGSLIAFEAGKSVVYGLYNAQDRGTLFIGPNTMVYEGMIVGENSRSDDMSVNVCRKKQITNMRASGSDEALRLTPHRQLSLEQCLEFIADDELLEVTPKELRMRKKHLTKEDRHRAAIKEKNQ